MRWVWVFVVLLGGAFLWLLLSARGRGAGKDRAAEASRERTGAPTELRLEAERGHAATVADREELSAAGSARAPTCLIRVIRREDGEPLPEAELFVQRREIGYAELTWNRAMARLNDVEAVLRTGLDERVALDARAEVRVPRPSRPISLAAAFGDLRAEGTIGLETERCELELEPYTRLVCEVVDAEGAPLEGAMVTLFSGVFDPLEDGWSFATDAHGRVEVLKLEEQMNSSASVIRVALGHGLRSEPPSIDFRPTEPPVEPLHFVVRESGRVVVELVDARGEPLVRDGWAALEVERDPGAPQALQRLGEGYLRRPFESGQVVFPHVALGRRLWVGANVLQADGSFEGSVSPRKELDLGAPRHVQLSLAGWSPLHLTARVVRDEGSGTLDYGELAAPPLTEFVRLLVVDDAGKPLRAEIRRDASTQPTDQDGLLRLAITTSELPVRVRAEALRHLASDWVELTSCSGEHRFVLARAPVVRGRLVVPAGFDLRASELSLELQAIDSDEVRRLEYRDDGAFFTQSGMVGRQILRVTLHDVLVFERTDIVLVAGQEADLGVIDLLGRVHGLSLELARADGGDTRSGEAEVFLEDGEALAWFPASRTGRLWIDSPRASVDLWASVAGARPTLFHGVRDGDRLVLPVAMALIVRVAADLWLPEAPIALVPYLERLAPEDVPFEYDSDSGLLALIDHERCARLPVAWPGTYALTWSVRHLGTEFEAELDLPPQEVTVPESGEVTVEAALTRAALAAALAELGG